MTKVEVTDNQDWYALFDGRTVWIKVENFMSSLRDACERDPMLWVELRDLMVRAAREGVPFGKGADGKGFKWPMQRCRDDLGHLKMDQGDDQHRVYFAAPLESGYETNLLALFYGLKHASDREWRKTQDDHIDLAHDYYQQWKNAVAVSALGL